MLNGLAKMCIVPVDYLVFLVTGGLGHLIRSGSARGQEPDLLARGRGRRGRALLGVVTLTLAAAAAIDEIRLVQLGRRRREERVEERLLPRGFRPTRPTGIRLADLGRSSVSRGRPGVEGDVSASVFGHRVEDDLEEGEEEAEDHPDVDHLEVGGLGQGRGRVEEERGHDEHPWKRRARAFSYFGVCFKLFLCGEKV